MSKSWLQFYKNKIYTCIPRLFIAVHVLYMTQCIFECVENKRNKKTFKN